MGRYPTATTEAIKKLLKKDPNMSYGKIANHFGVSRQAISQRMQKAKLRAKKPKILYNIDKDEIAKWIINNPDKSYVEGAKVFGCSDTAFAHMARNLGFKRVQNIRINKEKIIEIYKENPDLKMTQIAEKAGCAPMAVSNVLEEAGLREKIKQKIQDKEFKKYLKKHPKATAKEMAEVFGVTEYAIAKAKHRILYGPDKSTRNKDSKTKERADEKEILRLRDENPDWTVRQIAETAGFCLGSIGRILRKYKRQRGHKRMFDRDKMIAEFRKGKTMRELASKFGVSVNGIRAALCKEKLWIPKESGRITKEELKEFFKTCKSKQKTAEAAKHFGVTIPAISYLKKKYAMCKKKKYVPAKEVERLLLKGATIKQVAEVLECSVGTVYIVKRKMREKNNI